ncbi:multivesicular body subunit 12A isoform X2 [Melopsittacus undulatus]|uniref:multivesicular body subunit 12A isoform X2 n=1 Tax=Melopsittacus undulatus TaxID=13146 RepID=UPI00146F068A|nr:multivesicular body subunit 12A isoform X2 [Melopsittacus undulatus]
MAADEAPLTGVAWAAAPDAAPAGWTVIGVTVEGTAANLGKGFGLKSGGYLCVSGGRDQAPPGPVVTDVLVLSDRSPQPAGYTRAPEFPEPRPGGSRKKRLYVKLQPVSAADTAVVDIKLSSKSKTLPYYTRAGEMGNFAIWCKKGPVLKPVPKPRSISTGLKQLSLQSPDYGASAAPCSIKRAASQHEALYDTSNIYGLSAMDGVPFTLHPKFDTRFSSGSNALLTDLNVKSLAEIEAEYNYAFVVEKTAAARLPPSVC